ncbi:hypothetical protein ACUJ46_06175 [Sandaracinobacteroides sp. A072]|uniref:hypothetical protein n=1 Tax=Sandaracinobacteroides sp. A072 TaxID=3461146 RepID=UPI00404391D5
MDFWEAIVIITAIVVIGQVMRGGRWNRETRRWERFSPNNPYVRMGVPDETQALRRDISRLNERVATLEKLVTDPALRLTAEIESLRQPAAGEPGKAGHTERRTGEGPHQAG